MKLRLFYYKCKNCENKYKSPVLVGSGYGEFLMNNKSGEMVYLSSFDDPVFDEVEKLFDEVERVLVGSQKHPVLMNLQDKINLFQAIFSVACDKAPDGSSYGIMQNSACPNCGKMEVERYGPTSPPEYVEKDIKNVTHEKWNTFKMEGKKNLIKMAIANYFLEH